MATVHERRCVMLQFNNVLCPIDFSETSTRALTYATALARWYDAHLEVLHVVPVCEHDGPPTHVETAGGAWPSREQLIVALELMLYGSNAQHVVRAAPCPVLTVRA
jgi:nucleotide-binding universal stress UspA family protein